MDSHFNRLEQISIALDQANITLKLKNFWFRIHKFLYFGHLIDKIQFRIYDTTVKVLK